MKRILFSIIFAFSFVCLSVAKEPIVEPSFAWTITPPLGIHTPAQIDTLVLDYSLRSVPSAQSVAYATTGNLGAEGETLIYFDRRPASDFFFRDPLKAWLPSLEKIKFYNTRIPMTVLSYNFGGGKQTGQDRLKADFSGNINKDAQVGAMLDYLHSKGSYANQAAKNLTWGFSGSYIGERYQFQGFFYHYNSLNLENGGIEDDLYITDPAEIQGGITSVDTKNIPTNLTTASSRVVGTQLYLNNRYNLGFYRDIEVEEDSIVSKFVPVTSFIWTLDYRDNRHQFNNSNSIQAHLFWENFYLNPNETRDRTSFWSIRNTFGVSLLEGFNKYAKAGLSAFAIHEYRRYTQTADTVNRRLPLPVDLTPLPFENIPEAKGQNLLWVGAQLARRQGKILNYEATAQFGLVGDAAGEIEADGNIMTNIPLFRDSVVVTAYGHFSNQTVPYLLRKYISNHFAWDNDFGKTRRVRVGGELSIPRTETFLNIGFENVQNLVYFDENALPTQNSSSVRVFSATLKQNLRFKALNWENSITYQTSSDDISLPLPKLAIYSNLYLYFRIAKVLQVQLGIDCNYYTKYKAVGYQPATMAFYNQREIECGNYPFMNLYVNMKLSRARFYLMMSHINQGMTGNNYFSMPHYPLNPRRFQLGVSIDFLN